ncbi:hypothetical protein TNCV_3340961 [Trichonephila clavipes]|nr:hypothetical protein TNCV_3340961 [Trichonephila clavipes]
MARCFGNWSGSEVRAMIWLSWAKNVSASDIHCQVMEVYGEEAMGRQHVAKWCYSFQSADRMSKTLYVREQAT